ncbi:MAG: arsenate reductase ArsC [Roseovarius sp.]|nr:arsenate reductase ArsC [Roseovarius sp.]
MADAYNILVLCTGNSARSILAEAILNRDGLGRFIGFSAGSDPKPAPHPQALTLLQGLGHDISALRSKSWDEFAGPDVPKMDVILTVCDNAAGETCPIWPGHPVSAHWGLPDPASAPEADQPEAFAETYRRLQARVKAFMALPVETLDAAQLGALLTAIGAQDDTVYSPKQGQPE